MRALIFRGLFGLQFSTGMDAVAAKIKEADKSDKVSLHSWLFRTSIEKKLIKEWEKMKPEQKEAVRRAGGYVIGGHSLGGNSANYMGNNLVKAGLPVTYIFTVDPTEPRNNPKGVRADNFMSYDFRAEKVPGANNIKFPELSHIEVDKDPRVHRQILAGILAVKKAAAA